MRLSDLGVQPKRVKLSEIQPRVRLQAALDPTAINTESEALDNAFLAERDGNTELAAAFKARADEIRMGERSFVDNFHAGIGKSLYDTARGLGQLTGVLSQEEIDDAARTDAALMDTGGGITGNATGHIGQILLPAGAVVRSASVGGRASNVARIVLNPRVAATAQGTTRAASAARAGQAALAAGTVGAVQGGLQPVVTGDTRPGNAGEGFLFGAAGQGLGEGLGYVARRVIRAAAPGRQAEASAGEILRQAASDPATVARLQAGTAQGQRVAGSAPTTAEATRDMGLAGLERTLRTRAESAPAFAARDADRNAARVTAVQSAFLGASSDAADTLRAGVQQAQGPAIREAMKQTGAETARVVSSIDRMVKAPRFSSVPQVQQTLATVRGLLVTPIDDAGRLSAARSIANEAMGKPGRMSSADFDAVREAARLVRGAAQRGESSEAVLAQVKAIKPKSLAAKAHLSSMMRALRTAERGKPDVASLYNTRKYITQTLMPRADAEQMFALRGIVGKLDETIGEVAPTYRQYLTDYAAGMRQADQAEVGAAILKSGAARPSDKRTPVELARKTVDRLRDLDALARSATGFPRATAARTLTPEQMRVAREIAEDIDSAGFISTARANKGSITAEATQGQNRLARLATGVAAGSIPGGDLGVMAFEEILSQVGSKRGEAVQEIVAEALLDPQRAGEILAVLPVDVRREVVRIAGPTLGNLRAGAIAGSAAASSNRAAADNDQGRQ
jgi:hypothetical protein